MNIYVLLRLKKSSYKKVEEERKNTHPYELPDIVAVPISNVL